MSNWHHCRYGIIEGVTMVRKISPSELQDRIIVRLPDGMRDDLAEIAKSNNRSVNAEVVSCLERLLTRHSSKHPDTGVAEEVAPMAELRDQMSKLSQEMAQLRAFIQSAVSAAPLSDGGRFAKKMLAPKPDQ
jgi:hypothetical protein